MQTYEHNTLARFTNLLPNVIELNKSMGTRQVVLLEISWPSTIKTLLTTLLTNVLKRTRATELMILTTFPIGILKAWTKKKRQK